MASPISPIQLPTAAIPEVAGGSGNGSGFTSMFRDAVNAVENLNANAAAGIQRMLAGGGGELHRWP